MPTLRRKNLIVAGGIAGNVACHIPRLGYKNFATADDSVNVWWVALLAMAEGWHNNHHAFPASARSGLHWYEFDLSLLIIRLMKSLHLIGRINDMSRPQATPGLVAASSARPWSNTPRVIRATRRTPIHNKRVDGVAYSLPKSES